MDLFDGCDKFDLAASLQEVVEDVVLNMAVSYTHLRAHETVLDLVCRLLLEKKKNYLPIAASCYY